ncbi:MAG: multicopper oxidase domain-containing protein [Candidatus Eremiobacteraeota bacterium]|nr:multicopper oxidase domain-containing protein [Candidatus Eremiobacteraeota bacterium]
MSFQRGTVIPVALCAALTVAFAMPVAVRSQIPAQPVTVHPCAPGTPNPASIVEDPPVAPNPHNITLYAFQDGTRFCYKQHPTDAYREAPTIVARNHPGYFDITLINRLHAPAGSTSSAAHGSHMGAQPPPQGNPPCPVLDTGPTPPPMAPTGQTWPTPNPVRTFPSSPFLTYLDHRRAVDPYFPRPGVTPPHQGDTNLHFHGLDTDPLEDNVFRSTIVAPQRTCKFHIPLYANQAAGTYWYHTHMHHVAEVQVSGGLAGALIIVPTSQSPPSYEGRVLIVKDLVPAGQTSEAVKEKKRFSRLSSQHALAAPSAMPVTTAPPVTIASAAAGPPTPVPNVDPRNPPPWYTPTGNGDQSADCHGSTPAPNATYQPVQINGVLVPVTGDTHVRIPQTWHSAAADERYRIIDASANGYLHVKQYELVGGMRHEKRLVVVARDGVDVGKDHLAVNRRSVLVPPGGRLDISVARSANDQLIVADGDFCAGNNGDATPSRDLLVIHPAKAVRATSAHRMAAAPAPVPHLADATHLTAADTFVNALKPEAQRPHRVLTFQQYWDGFYVTETSGDDPRHPTANGFVEEPFTLAPPQMGSHDTYVMPTIHVHRPKGTPGSPPPPYVEHWTLVNAATQIHAFHIHQLTFVTLNNPFEPRQTRVFEDTTPLMPGTPCIMQPDGTTCVKRTDDTFTQWVLPTKTEIEIDFSKVPVGRWVYHCHMLDHEDKGMMGIIQVD